MPFTLPNVLQLTGIKTSEKKQVGLFFLHNFFIGIGSVLIYTSANVILLENHPEYSLPIAYIASALLMMVVGKIYEHYEHHLSLKKLSNNVLVVTCVLASLVMIASFFSHSMLMAIGIMVVYRIIYLLANLEFWGLSALLFDVRQSKRLFSIIGAGDMPAKLLGAILAVLIHSASAVPVLIGIAAIMFLLALSTQKRTFSSIRISKGHAAHTHEEAFGIVNLFSRNQLIFRISLGYAFIVTIAIFIEYSFFVNVKHKFHSQHNVMIFVGQILAITYFVGLFFKLLFSQKFLERLGVKTALYILPALALSLSGILVFLLRGSSSEQQLLLYFCIYYLSFEVIRRTVFDPVFLVIFQPLNSHQRLKGHTVAKGFYEPLGIGITGAALLLLYYVPSLAGWFDFLFIAFIALLAIISFAAAYRSYVFTLQSAIKKRFLHTEEFGVRKEAVKIYSEQLDSSRFAEVLTAIEWLKRYQSGILFKNAESLLQHTNAQVREAIFRFLDETKQHRSRDFYTKLLRNETDATMKYLLAKQVVLPELLSATDKDIMKGTIVGGLAQQLPSAQRALESLLNSPYENAVLIGLEIVEKSTTKTAHFTRINELLTQAESNDLKNKAIELAAVEKAIPFVATPFWKSAIKNLAQSATDFDFVTSVSKTADTKVANRLLKICENATASPQKQALLYSFAAANRTRLLALKMLNSQHISIPKELFGSILSEEITLSKRLFEGIANKNLAYLHSELQNEVERLIERIFMLLMLLYDKNSVMNAMIGVHHSEKERRANSLEILENILPKAIYQPFQTILSDETPDKKVKELEKSIKKSGDRIDLTTYILEKGVSEFGNWTIAKTIQHYTHTDETVLKPYITHSNPIFRESIALLSKKTTLSAELATLITMKHAEESLAQISFIERVISLKNTPLFHAISENVLSAVAPIMQEVKLDEGEVIFEKDELGDSMYVIFEGSVAIKDKQTELARFGKYDFFGELALLDAEARSASAIALTDALLFKITQEDFYELLEEQPELMRNIIKALSQRIRVQNMKMVNK